MVYTCQALVRISGLYVSAALDVAIHTNVATRKPASF
jgi:hypothetical protein